VSTFKEFLADSFLSGSNSYYIEDLYEQYLDDEQSVDENWRQLFAAFPKELADVRHSSIIEHLKNHNNNPSIVTNDLSVSSGISEWINNLRANGFRYANINPLNVDFKLSENIAASSFNLLLDSNELIGKEKTLLSGDLPVGEAINLLQKSYCGTIGLEAIFIADDNIKKWLWSNLQKWPKAALEEVEKLDLYKRLVSANHFEQHLARKFVAQKRFSLEGGDSLIPLVESIITRGVTEHGLKECAVAMAHRGRLNLMANVFGVSMDTIFKRFTGELDKDLEISGDVKYHLGASIDRNIAGKNVHLSLACNPSHLEFVNPVLQGIVRAKQDKYYQNSKSDICGITIHGDAAVCGQGIVPETLNLTRTAAHNIQGMIHIVINNQVGHSVSNVADMTSCNYITDIFKSFDIPVIHVNGDDPEAVVFVARLAMDYRAKFKQDVAIELLCYRRLGHNEADEPLVTQPLMYKQIKQHPRLFELYKKRLLESGVKEQDLLAIEKEISSVFDSGKSIISCKPGDVTKKRQKLWQGFCHSEWQENVETSVEKSKLLDLARLLQQLPSGFVCQKQIERLIEQRANMVAEKSALNWGMAELLSYASLVADGVSIRLVGQDVRRGTFSHRQAVLHDFDTGVEHSLFHGINNQLASFEVYDSTLSEAAVLGAEYGYSLAHPSALVLWEAQFGDFANSAQVIIDQFISSAWQKWQQLSNLVMLLPHGYEGQGPEHSSARLERFLQLSAQHSMQVCVPTTPSQIFHLIRRQAKRKFRQPLIIMTPKSLLRHPLAVSEFKDLSSDKFNCVLDDSVSDKNKIDRVVVCSGKIYFELLEKRKEEGINNIALIRIEQLYPFPYDLAKQIFVKYANAKEVVWCQEEPRNQGAWFSRRHCLEESIADHQKLLYVGRDMYASTAAGSPKLHKSRQLSVISQALGLVEISLVKYD
jgi:2-oxoglutarate dehydrogenase E1 component